jgi:putative ABC transport system permease protein
VRIENVMTAAVDLPLAKYSTATAATNFYRSLVERLQGVPGVERAALSQDLPLQGVHGGELFAVAGQSEMLTVRFKRIDAQYLAALDIPVLAGRGITENDRADSPRVLLINQELANVLSKKFGITDPAGRVVQISYPGYGKAEGGRGPIQIVGVIRNERTGNLDAPENMVIYVPLAQYPRTDVKVVVRTTQADPRAAASAIRDAVRQIDPELPVADIKTMGQVKERSLASTEQPTWLIGCFAAVAALLAALGLYGVIAHSVVQQRKEIGIRMALGASSSVVLSQILSSALKLTLTGLFLGMIGAFAVTRVMKTVLFEVSPLDPYSIAIASLSMIAIGVLAGLIPASRASRVDPVTTLRAE